MKQKSDLDHAQNFEVFQQVKSPSAASEMKNSFNASLSDDQSQGDDEQGHVVTDDDLLALKNQTQKLLTKKALKVCDSSTASPPRDLPS